MPDSLIRDGRVDVKQHIGLANKGQAEGLFRNFYPEVNDKVVDSFVELIEEER